MISKDTALPDGPVARLRPVRGRRRRTSSTARGSTSSCTRCTEAVLTDGDLLSVGEMPGVTLEEARLFTDPARAEVDMVFQFEHVGLDHGRVQVGHAPAATCATSRPASAAGRPGLAERRLEQPLLGQPRPAADRLPLGDDGSPLSAKTLGTLLHLHRGTPYVYQGEELGMTNYPFGDIDEFRDIESLNHYADAVAARRRPGPRAGRAARRSAATTPARRCSGTRRPTPGSPPARRGCRSTRTTPRSTRPPSGTTRTRC